MNTTTRKNCGEFLGILTNGLIHLKIQTNSRFAYVLEILIHIPC
jgi:hypothetical protein